MKIRKFIANLILMLLLVLALPAYVWAAEQRDPNQPVSLSVDYHDGSKALAGARFDLYLICRLNEHGSLTLTDQFSEYNIVIEGDEADWYALPSTLEGYILRDQIPATDSGVTDADGHLDFPHQTDVLQHGLYLVMGHKFTADGKSYDTSPFIVMLPTMDSDNEKWVYTLEVKPKGGSVPGGNTIARKVLKIWDDDGNTQNRPEEITVQLLRDGKLYDTVVLSDGNNWRYTWENLDADSKWTVVEKDVDDRYNVKVTLEGITFVVTNTLPDVPPPPPPENPPHLPQTGQLWWPVPVLMAAGLALVLFGVLRRKGDEDA